MGDDDGRRHQHVDTNGFSSSCFRDPMNACSNSSGNSSSDESQQASLFLEPKVQSAHHGNSSCFHRSTSRAKSGDNVGRLLAADLNSLSIQERDIIYDEIHGVASPVEETPHFVQATLHALQQDIKKIKHKPAYDHAMTMEPDYIQNPAFCIQFLRAKRFNAKEAAAQLVAHLEMKQELFGSNKLCTDIKFTDLDEDDRNLLRSGAYPFLVTRDRAGRAICILINRLLEYKSFKNWARTLFYIFMSHLRDKEVQRRGAVGIAWMHGSSMNLTHMDFRMWSSASAVADCLPLRISGGVHYCAAGARLHPGLELGMTITGSHLRVRFRAHVGSPMECLYNLASYGIPLQALPINADGKVILDEHLNRCHQLSVADATPHPTPGNRSESVTPSPSDILMGGKSKEFMYNPGNLTLRKMVEEALPKYNSMLSRVDKTAIAQEIVQKIKSDGGRFLNREYDLTWKEVDNGIAREKVAHAFRNQRRLFNKKSLTHER